MNKKKVQNRCFFGGGEGCVPNLPRTPRFFFIRVGGGSRFALLVGLGGGGLVAGVLERLTFPPPCPPMARTAGNRQGSRANVVVTVALQFDKVPAKSQKTSSGAVRKTGVPVGGGRCPQKEMQTHFIYFAFFE